MSSTEIAPAGVHVEKHEKDGYYRRMSAFVRDARVLGSTSGIQYGPVIGAPFSA
jgi:hypothetical protein